MQFIQEPGYMDLFGINPRWIGVQRNGNSADKVKLTVSKSIGALQYELIGIITNYYNNSEVYFNIGHLMPLEYDLPNTNSIQNFEVKKMEQGVSLYKVDAVEYTGDTAGTSLMFLKYALHGGRDVITNRTYNFFDDFATNQKFLTLQPREKLITTEQPEWLYYPLIYPEASNTLHYWLKIKLHFSDDTDTTITKLIVPNSETFTGVKGEVVILPTGYDQLNLSSYENANKYIMQYEVYVEAYRVFTPVGATVGEWVLQHTTEHFTYVMDYDLQSWKKRYFLFRNSLGGMDTLCTRGKASIEAAQKKKHYAIQQTHEMPISLHPMRTLPIKNQKRTKINIGYLERPQREWLEDFAGSDLHWEIDVEAAQFLPIQITSAKINIHEDDQPLQDAEFTFQYPENFAR